MPACQPVVGTTNKEDVVMAYSTDCNVVVGESETAITVIDAAAGVPLTTKAVDTAAPSPIATALAVTVPDTVTAAVAPVTFACATVEGTVIVLVLALYVVGVPVIGTVTTVLLVRTAVPAVSPGGRVDWVGAKFAGVIGVMYVLFESVYTMLAPLTGCPAFRLASPVEVTAMVAAASVLIAALLRTAVPALKFAFAFERAHT